MTRKNNPFFPILGIGIYLIASISLGNIVSVSGQTDQPKITELEIPGVLSMDVEANGTSGNLLNTSYTFNGKEYYFLLNLTHVNFQEADTADCIDKESETGEKNYMCLPSDANDFSTRALFCDTNIADCIQPSGRHKN